MSVACVSADEDALIEGIAVGDALTDGIYGVPFDVVPFDKVRVEDLLCGFLDLFGGGGFAWAEVWVCGGGYLDVETDHVVFSGDDHDGAMF